MRLLINIPKEFEQHFQADRFEDSLHRLSADVHLLGGNYEQELAVMLIESFKSAVPIPPHGRLIDADTLLNLLNNCMFPSDMVTTMAVRMATNWIKEAPTVIETEEGE